MKPARRSSFRRRGCISRTGSHGPSRTPSPSPRGWTPIGLIAALEAEIDRLADDEHALAPEERQAQERQLRAELLAAERLEEAAVMQAKDDGVEILRRPAADPRAVLGLADHVGD